MANHASLLRPNELWTAASRVQATLHKSNHHSAVNSLTRGSLSEISGARSSGKTSLCLHLLAQATARGEVCAVIDLHDSFHPASARAAGIALEQLVWVRCQSDIQHTMRAADLLLHAGGFGMVLLDVCEASPQALQRIPLSHWYRLRRAVEHTPTILLVCSAASQGKGNLISKLSVKRKAQHWTGEGPFLRFHGWEAVVVSSKTLELGPERLSLSSVA